MRDPRAEAIRSYIEAARRLRFQARAARSSGFGAWYYELMGLLMIAERAVKAEVADNPPRFIP